MTSSLLGVSRPPIPHSPLSSCHLWATPPLHTRKLWEDLIRDKTAYTGSLMIIFLAQMLFLCFGLIRPLKSILNCGVCLKFQWKEGILSSTPSPPPSPRVIMSSHVIFWPTLPLPSPSSDDIIYEQPLTKNCMWRKLTTFSSCLKNRRVNHIFAICVNNFLTRNNVVSVKQKK